MHRLTLFLFFSLCINSIEGAHIPITLEYAKTEEEVENGLMHVSDLKPNHGMLFCFPHPRKLKFWMYNTLIDLSIAFLDEYQIIREIYELKSFPEIKDPSFFEKLAVTSTIYAQYALEMNKQWFAKHKIKPGDRVLWDPLSPHGYIDTNH